jgi:quercetin dioxygenase-like cupin family protein
MFMRLHSQSFNFTFVLLKTSQQPRTFMETTIALSSLKDTVRAQPGTRMSFRLTSAETNGASAVIDVNLLPGNEPPRHCHEREDEVNILREGSITYFIGDDIIQAEAGDVVFLPRAVPHKFKVTSAEASVTLIVTPGGLENFFEKITLPCHTEAVPPISGPPSKEHIERVIKTAAQFGLSFISL